MVEVVTLTVWAFVEFEALEILEVVTLTVWGFVEFETLEMVDLWTLVFVTQHEFPALPAPVAGVVVLPLCVWPHPGLPSLPLCVPRSLLTLRSRRSLPTGGSTGV